MAILEERHSLNCKRPVTLPPSIGAESYPSYPSYPQAKVGLTFNKPPVYHRVTNVERQTAPGKQTSTVTHINTYEQLRLANSPNLDALALQGEAGELTQAQEEHRNSTQQGLSCNETQDFL